MASDSVFDAVKSRIGVPIVVTLGSDGTSYKGALTAVYPDGCDSSNGGPGSDYVMLTVKLSRAKS
jgi:hypothetical protein